MSLNEKLHSDILKNIIQTSEGPFLQAGANQFQSFWTRDFCFASWGLSAVGEYEVVKNHLQYLLNNLRSDGLVPRIIESQWSGKTVVLNTVFRFLPQSLKKNKHRKKLKPEYLGEHGTLSIDSNSLAIISSLLYAEYSGDKDFISRNRDKLILAYQFYETRLNSGLIEQEEFEDWQDSVKRFGKTFYTNILYWYAGKLLYENHILSIDLARREFLINDCFWRDDFFASREDYEQKSLAGNYLAILFGYNIPGGTQALFERLEEFQNKNFPYCTIPPYPLNQISWTTRMVGLRHYHDKMHWSWILGLKLACQRKLNLTSSEPLLEELIKRDQTIYEIYNEKLEPFETLSYKSESPFSWGIGINLWAISKF